MLVEQVNGNVDIVYISETKLNNSFLDGQFRIPGFAVSFRRDGNFRWWHNCFHKRRYTLYTPITETRIIYRAKYLQEKVAYKAVPITLKEMFFKSFGSLDLCMSTCIMTITYYDK